MKTADGGYRPCYNVQFASDAGARLIVAVDVTNSGSDRVRQRPRPAATASGSDRIRQRPRPDGADARGDL
jgi:predicted acylesterase/phospholipase RssA